MSARMAGEYGRMDNGEWCGRLVNFACPSEYRIVASTSLHGGRPRSERRSQCLRCLDVVGGKMKQNHWC